MNNLDSIIDNSNNDSKNNFDKTEWKKKIKEERKLAYDIIAETTVEIVKDIEKFKTYLEVQGRMNKYSVGNALLITKQMPHATQLKDFKDWNSMGYYIKKNANHIIILEPGNSYIKADGSSNISFNPKKMFDISQTTAKISVKSNSYDDKQKITALLKDCPVDIKTVDDVFSNNRIAEWNKEDNVLYVTRTDDTQRVFKDIATELARVGLEENDNQELNDFKCNCISYMLCQKHDIANLSLEINSIPDSLKNMNSNEIKKELNSMRSVMQDINTRMDQYFENLSKTQKNMDYER